MIRWPWKKRREPQPKWVTYFIESGQLRHVFHPNTEVELERLRARMAEEDQ